MRVLRITDVAANVAHRFVDVAVGYREIERAVEIHVQESTAETQSAFRRAADAALLRDVVVSGGRNSPIQTNHFVIKICDGYAGPAGVVEIAGVHAHPGASLAFGAEGQPGFYRDIFEFSIAKIAIQLIRLRIVGH